MTAPAVFDRPIDTSTFHAYVEQVLVPTLRRGDGGPIEQAFANLKAFLRAARPRTFDDVCALIAAAIALFTPTECANYVRNSGYRGATALRNALGCGC